MRACLKCGFINQSSTVKATDACPDCGAIYAKVDLARQGALPPARLLPPSANSRSTKSSPRRPKLTAGSLLVMCILGAAILYFNRPDYGVEGTGEATSSSASDYNYFVACSNLIERSAKWDHEWTSTIGRFRELGATADGNKLFSGDSLKLQNGFGAWQKVSYLCVYNPSTQTATEATII